MMENQDFSECVIVPVKLFSQCTFEKQGEKHTILDNPNLSPDLKLKLHHQKKKLDQVKNIQETKTNTVNSSTYLGEFPESKRPVAKSIFELLLQNPNSVAWNEKLEVTLNGKFFPLSNIVLLVQYVLGEVVITSEKDKPAGAENFVQVLKDIGVPSQWLKIKRPVRRSKRPAQSSPVMPGSKTRKRLFPSSPEMPRSKTRKQVGKGAWICL